MIDPQRTEGEPLNFLDPKTQRLLGERPVRHDDAEVVDPPLDRQRARVPRRQPGRPAPRRSSGRRRHRHRRRRPGLPLLRRPRGARQPRHLGLERRRQHVAQEPAGRPERRRRPPVVRDRQRPDDLGRRQHDLHGLPRDGRRHVHLLEPRLDRPDRPGRRARLAERFREGAAPARRGRDLRPAALRPEVPQPVLRLQRGRPRARDDRPRGARPADGDPVPQRRRSRSRRAAAARGTSSRRWRSTRAATSTRPGSTTNDSGVYYSSSTDQGESWTTPVRVSTAPSTTAEFLWAQAGAAGNARARVVRDRHRRPARLVPELGQRPAGRDRRQVVGLRGHGRERRLALADDRAAAVHREADALRPDLQPGDRLHGLGRRPHDGRLLRAQPRQERRDPDRLQRHDEPEPRRAPVRGAAARRQDDHRQEGQRPRAEEPDEGRRRRRPVAALLARSARARTSRSST